jgi:hypothetical protein
VVKHIGVSPPSSNSVLLVLRKRSSPVSRATESSQSEPIGLSNFNSLHSQDVVRRGCVEEEVGERVIVDVIQPRKLHIPPVDFTGVLAFEVLPFSIFKEFESLGDSSLQFFKRLLVVVPWLVGNSSDPDCEEFGGIGGGLDLERQVVHVSNNSALDKLGMWYPLGVGEVFSFREDFGEDLKGPDHGENSRVIKIEGRHDAFVAAVCLLGRSVPVE